jgi:hypothetical protein
MCKRDAGEFLCPICGGDDWVSVIRQTLFVDTRVERSLSPVRRLVVHAGGKLIRVLTGTMR